MFDSSVGTTRGASSRSVGLLVATVFAISFIAPTIDMISFGKSYPLGDWLIGYQEGFVRRGLLGALADVASSVTGLPYVSLVIGLIVLIFGGFVYLTWLIFRLAPLNFVTVAIMLSPAFLLSQVTESNGYRKEMVFFLVLALFLVLSRGNTGHRLIGLLTLAFSGPLVVLVHEGLIFALPLLAVAVWFSVKTSRYVAAHAYSALVLGLLGGLGAFLASALNRGSPEIAESLCSSLMEQGLERKICRSVLPLGNDFVDTLYFNAEIVRDNNYLAVYLVASILALVPFLGIHLPKKAITLFALAALSLSPLAIVGIDWGRWLLIATISISLIVLSFAGTQLVEFREPIISLDQSRVVWGLLFIFATSWSVPTHSLDRLGSGLLGWFLSGFDVLWVTLLWPLILSAKNLVLLFFS